MVGGNVLRDCLRDGPDIEAVLEELMEGFHVESTVKPSRGKGVPKAFR